MAQRSAEAAVANPAEPLTPHSLRDASLYLYASGRPKQNCVFGRISAISDSSLGETPQ
jgi:hypothetical protein